MDFKDYIKSLPNQQQDTIKELAAATMTSVFTVYRWINGTVEPPLIKKKIIADVLKVPLDELFPSNN